MAEDDKPTKFTELTPALAVIGTIVGAPIAFLKASGLADDLRAAYGIAIKDLLWVITCGAALAIAFVFLWYFETLGGGAEAAGSALRERFNRERARLADYRVADDGYAQRLKVVLAWIDRFFDSDQVPSHRVLFLNEPAHVWTVTAYDRCLLLALIYPIIAIFFCWTIAGHVGPAESALGLKEAHGWLRAGTTGSLVLIGVTFFKFARAEGLPKFFWGVTALCAYAATIVFSGVGSGAAAIASAALFAFITVSNLPVSAIVVFVGVFAFTGAIASTFFFTVPAPVPVVLAVTLIFIFGFGVARLATISHWSGRRGLFLVVYCAMMFTLCLLAARMLATPEMTEYFNWGGAKPLLLFLGLFTIVNAPFDWLSLGLTRLLLRYGIEKGGYWPYALAVVDAVVASLLITILALAMACSNDLFNFLAEQGGGAQASVLPPSSFYLGMLESDPAAPEFWWLYATLFSTMIPSVINLFIAGFSFLRTLPRARNFVLSNMREGETMPIIARVVSSTILAAQVALAWPLAIAAQVFLTYVVLWQIMPRLGLGILHLVETLSL